MKCDKCGTEMNVVRTDYELMVVCPKCGWNVVTTVSPEIVEDEKEYGIYLDGPQNASREALKVVSQIIGSNYLAAKKALSAEPGSLLIADKALRIKRLARALNGADLRYEIKPSFPYDLNDPFGDDYEI
jgi:predicted  nucleic acid-binding Zn-ribbon protein